MHIHTRFSVEELGQAEYVDGFSFTKGLKVLKVPGTGRGSSPQTRETFLFDLENDYARWILFRIQKLRRE